MENLYAIYTYKFVENNDPGDLFQDGQSKATDMSTAQDVFYGLFMPKNNLFRVQKVEGDTAKKYTCEVYGNESRMVALRLFNMKEEHYWEIVEKPHDPMGTVERKSLTSTPCTFVIIDCRPNKNILAVKVETEAWRNTDVVRDLMEESINLQLESLSCGFRVQLFTKMQSHNFFEYSKKRIKKEGRAVKKMTIHFKTGKMNSKVEAVVKSSDYLKRLFNVIDKYALSGAMTLNQPIGPKLIDARRHDIENIVSLIESDSQGYGLDITFDDNMTLHCGKDVRAELPMKPEGALELFHIGQRIEEGTQLTIEFDNIPKMTEDKFLLEGWLDDVAEQTEKMKDAETVKPKRGRKNRRKAS